MPYSATISNADEDGYVLVVVYYHDRDTDSVGWEREVDRQTMRADIAAQWTAQELTIMNGFEDEPRLCPHGLSAALCEGPGHYPED